MQAIRTLMDDLLFPECLRWHENEIWFVDMYAGDVWRVDLAGCSHRVFSKPTILGGIGWLPSGELLVVDKLSRQVLRITNGAQQVHADLQSFGSSRLNDMLVLPDGTAFVGEYGFDSSRGEPFKKGNLYRIFPDGIVQIAATDLSFPNGMVVSSDSTIFIVAETMARRLTRFTLTSEFELTNRTKLAVTEAGYPDGISLDQYGRVFAALVDAKRVSVFGEDGSHRDNLDLTEQPYDVLCIHEQGFVVVATSSAQQSDLDLKSPPMTGKLHLFKIGQG